jgi:hypothetical protein
LTVRANVFFDIRDGGPTIKLSVFNTLINFENSYLNFTMTEEKPLSANSVKSDSACEFALPCIESQILYWSVMLATIMVVSSESELFATSGLHGNSCLEFDDPQTILNVPRSLHFLRGSNIPQGQSYSRIIASDAGSSGVEFQRSKSLTGGRRRNTPSVALI